MKDRSHPFLATMVRERQPPCKCQFITNVVSQLLQNIYIHIFIHNPNTVVKYYNDTLRNHLIVMSVNMNIYVKIICFDLSTMQF